jgi:hypothetical protein
VFQLDARQCDDAHTYDHRPMLRVEVASGMIVISNADNEQIGDIPHMNVSSAVDSLLALHAAL